MGFAVMGVAMPPEDQLFEQEEQHDSAEQRREYGSCREMCERFRQENEKGNAKQSADGIADEPRHYREANPVVKR